MITTDQLVQEVREQADEQNTKAKTTAAIIRVLNRGMRIANSVLARHYSDPLITSTTLDLSDGAEQDIPTDCFEDRVEYIQISVTGGATETRRRNFRDSTRLGAGGSTAAPWTWEIRGREIVFQQTPTGAYDALAFYLRKLEKLTPVQGRLTATPASTYLLVEQEEGQGDDLDSNSDARESYINVVNWATGEIRATFQIASIVDAQINLRATPLRSTYLGRTVSGSASLATCGAEADDYICLAEGTCVPFFSDGLSDYLVQYAVAAVTRSLQNGDARLEEQLVADARERVRAAGSGRGQTDRVKHRSAAWPSVARVWPTQA